jgi:hypothetical protein
MEFEVPVIVKVGVPDVVLIIPVVVLVRFPAIEIESLILKVAPVATVTLLLTKFVPEPLKVVDPVIERA